MPGHGHELTRLRIALTAFFALDGFVFAGWVVRIPAVKERTGASAGALGLALLGVSAGAVVTMTLTGRLCRRYGDHRVTVVCAVLLCLSVALPPLTRSVLALGAVLLVFGMAYGGINVAFNSAAVAVVAALRRPVMPSFHAAFSLGGMAGAGLGGLVAGAFSPAVHLSGLAVIGLLVTLVAGRVLLRHRPPTAPDDTPPPVGGAAADDTPPPVGGAAREDAAPPVGGAAADDTPPSGVNRRSRRLVVTFGLIALGTAYGEGALADWSALHLEQDLGAAPGLAAAGYTCFALAMAVGRLSGTRLLERLGRTRTLVWGGATAAAGMLVASLVPSVWAALAGFVVTGLGLANLFPVAIERAGRLAGAGGVALASTLGYGGMLLGPPAIGFMAEWFSLPVALTSVAVLAATAAVVALTARGGLTSAHKAGSRPRG
ncbi:MFS transporter [Streptomyces sp. NPDC006186]|uniref:MFS transporter n=1 Tax=Streptomyces sp. NPDC006186 TaxID=3155248 RepID=UPI00339E75CB